MKVYCAKNLDNMELFKLFIKKPFYRWTKTFEIRIWEVSRISQIDYKPTTKWTSNGRF